MNYLLNSITNELGEGIILRKPNSIYESGRSTSLVKLKVLLIILLINTMNELKVRMKIKKIEVMTNFFICNKDIQ